MSEPTFTVTIKSGVVHLVYDEMTRDQLRAAVHEALDIVLEREGGDFTITSAQNRAPVKRAADEPHDFESEGDAPEGGLGPCAVCGYGRNAPIHAALPVFSGLMQQVFG